MWMHAVTLIGSNTFLFASSKSVTEGVGHGASQAALTLQAPLTLASGDCRILA